MPAALLFELATATARCLLDQPGGNAAATCALAGASIPAPLLLAPASQAEALVTCAVDTDQGSLSVRSGFGGVHLTARAAGCRAREVAVAAPSSSPTSGGSLVVDRAAWAALQALRGSLTASAPAPAAAAAVLAEVARLPCPGSGDGCTYYAHPAALDSTIHAGAVLGLAGPAGEPPAGIRIPAGLAAFFAHERLGDAAVWAAVGNVATQRDGSAHSDFEAGGGHGPGVALLQLASRPLRAPQAQPRQRVEDMLYQAQWCAAQPGARPAVGMAAAAGGADQRAHGALAWVVAAAAGGPSPAVEVQPAGASEAEVLSGSLAWLQSALKQQPGSVHSRIGLHGPGSGALGSITALNSASSAGTPNSCVVAAGVAAMLRVAARENPSLQLYSLQASGASVASPAQTAPPASADAYGIAADAGLLLTPQLLQAPLPVLPRAAGGTAQAAPASTVADRVVITGGLGDLGLLVGGWLAQQPAACSVQLVARSPHSKAALVPRLAAAGSGGSGGGGAVTVSMADLGCSEDVAALRAGAPLAGVMHAGGVLRDAMLANQSAGTMRAVVAPKAAGLQQLLARLAAEAPLAWVALFSSTASLIGPAGQANYAAANAVLDALAGQQQQSGRRTLSIQWGAWALGMAGKDASLAARIKASGMGVIAPGLGLAALASALTPTKSRLAASRVATPFDWPRLQRAAGGRPPPLFAEFSSSSSSGSGQAMGMRPVAGTEADAAAAARKYPAAPAARRLLGVTPEQAAAQIGSLVEAVVGSRIAVDQPFMEAGLDSLAAVELRNSLMSAFGLELPATVTFDHPSIEALAAFVRQQLAAQHQQQQATGFDGSMGSLNAPPALDTAAVQSEVATIVAGLLGAKVEPDQPLMEAGLDSLGEAPASRCRAAVNHHRNHLTGTALCASRTQRRARDHAPAVSPRC